MKRQVLIAIALASLVALAGCSGIFGDDQNPTPTVDGNESNTNNTTQTPGTDDLPESDLNATEVAERHVAALQNADSYTAQIGQRTQNVGENATPNRQEVYRTHEVDLTAGEEQVRVEVLQGGTGPNNEGAIRSVDQYYNTNGTIYLNRTQFNQTQYNMQETGEPVSVNSSSQTQMLNLFIETMAYEKAEEMTLNETAAVRYDMVGVTDMDNLTQMSNATFTNVRSSIVIDENDVVRRIAFTGNLETPQQNMSIGLSVFYEGLGETTVTEPAWVDDAKNASNSTDTETTPSPQAGVTFDQSMDSNSVEVQIVSMERAERVFVDSSNGNITYNSGNALTAVGETATVTGLSDGDQVIVIGEFDGQQEVLQMYTYEE